MKAIFLALCSLFLCSVVHGQSHVQKCKEFFDVSGKSYTNFACSFSAQTAAGNSVIVGFGFGTNNPTITVTDDGGNAYKVICRTWDSGHNQGLAVIRGVATAQSTKVNVAVSSGVQYVTLVAHEISGLGDNEISGCKTAASPSTKTATPAGGRVTLTATDYIFSAVLETSMGSGVKFTPGSGFVLRSDLGSVAAYADEDAVASNTAQGTWTISPASTWLAVTYAVKSAAAQPVTVTIQVVYDDGTPFKGTGILFVEDATEYQAGSAVFDQTGTASLTFVPDYTKTYQVRILDSQATVVFSSWSLPLGASIAQQVIASLSSGLTRVTISKANNGIVGVVKQ